MTRISRGNHKRMRFWPLPNSIIPANAKNTHFHKSCPLFYIISKTWFFCFQAWRKVTHHSQISSVRYNVQWIVDFFIKWVHFPCLNFNIVHIYVHFTTACQPYMEIIYIHDISGFCPVNKWYLSTRCYFHLVKISCVIFSVKITYNCEVTICIVCSIVDWK